MLTVGSLFAGIGGFDLGFERAGMVTRWQVEQDPFCRKVLARHFPTAGRYEDVRDVGRHNLEPVDVICGGFPCQDISLAGKGTGIEGERSGLWSEYARIVGELQPRYVVVENVAALTSRGLGTVLGDLAACGYDAEWDCIPASAVGAHHRRDRIWIVAYSNGGDGQSVPVPRSTLRGEVEGEGSNGDAGGASQGAGTVGDPFSQRCQESGDINAGSVVSEGGERERSHPGSWLPEPGVGRVAYGVPVRLVGPRLKALGNALVPQIAEWIGQRIVEWES